MSKPKLSLPPPPSPAAMDAARTFNLGALRQTIPVDKYPAVRSRVIGYAHEFDDGLVLHLDNAEPEAYRWDALTAVTWSATNSYSSGFYMGTHFSSFFRCSDGRSLRVSGVCKDPTAKGGRKADPQAAGYRLFGLLTRARDMVSAMLLPGAIAALDRGEHLTFGDFQISSAGIQAPKGFVPWSSIRGVNVVQGRVSVRQEHKFFALSSKGVNQIPNLPLFLILAETLRRQAAGNTSLD